MLRRLELVDMDAAVRVLRTAFDHALPSLAGLHTAKEDRWFFRERVFRGVRGLGSFRWRRDDRNARLPGRLDRSIVCAAEGSRARSWHGAAAGRPALF